MKKKIIILAIIIVILASTVITYFYTRKKFVITGNRVDDWNYNENTVDDNSNYFNLSGKSTGIVNSIAECCDSATSDGVSKSSSNLGFSTGGAKNVENFRENIKNNYFPISTDITYNGLFYDYCFDTGNTVQSKELFSPSYSIATSKDPISGELEYYMSVGLNSNIKESDFARKKLNLVLVLDISGSMGSCFNSYYYDGYYEENNVKEDDEEELKSKMKLAEESLNILIDQLNDDDRLGIVLFDDSSYLAKEINLVGNTDIEALKGHILEIAERGGTNFEEGYKEATKQFKGIENSDEYENRIIVLTDAMPNYGETSKDGLLKYVEDNAKDRIYTTFIGIGVDFNTELIEQIGTIRGANYYSVNSAAKFKETMKEDFEFMVTPMVFDLNLKFESNDYEIEAVYGTDAEEASKGNIMHVNTLFPSRSNSEGEVKGGIVLLKLNKKSNEDGRITLSVDYTDRKGKDFSNEQEVTYKQADGEQYDNTGIRKAIALTRYVNVLKNWILYERSEEKRFIITPQIGIEDCIYTEDEVYKILGEYERTSVRLTVSKEYKEIFGKMKTYIENEMTAVKDNTMSQEIEILEKLSN